MHRLLADLAELSSDRPRLGSEALGHLRVLRPKDGESFELFDGRGVSRVYRYCAAEKALVAAPGEGIRTAAAPVRPLTLFACVTKGSRWDWTVEKATELGVSRIVPVISERTIVRVGSADREAKRLRWRRIAEEAARQSDAQFVPEVVAPVGFAEALRMAGETACLVGAIADPPPPTIGEVLFSRPLPSRPLAVFIGPEGDFTPDELAALVAVATPVSFGTTILRAETAAIYALSVLKSFADA